MCVSILSYCPPEAGSKQAPPCTSGDLRGLVVGSVGRVGGDGGTGHLPSIASEMALSALQLGLGGPFSPDVSRLPLQSLLWTGSPSASPPSRAWAALACKSARIMNEKSHSEAGGWTR